MTSRVARSATDVAKPNEESLDGRPESEVIEIPLVRKDRAAGPAIELANPTAASPVRRLVRTARPAKPDAEPTVDPLGGQHTRSARSANDEAKPIAPPLGGQVGWHHLRAVAEEYDALQHYRISAANRASHAADSLLELSDIGARTKTIEEDLGRVLTATFRQVVPKQIRKWQRDQAGVGELQLARLLGHLGHPRIATPYHWEGEGSERVLMADQPFERTVGQLYAYCGRTGDPARRRRKSMTADEAMLGGKPALKMLTHLIAEAMIKAGVRVTGERSPVYDVDARTAVTRWGQSYLDYRKLHAGFGWTPGHQHNAALHRMAKDMLRELWVIST